MGARAFAQWNVLIPTPTSGACVRPCPRGEGAWVWPHSTVSCMQSEAMTHPPQITALASPTALKGKHPTSLDPGTCFKEKKSLVTFFRSSIIEQAQISMSALTT